MQKKNAASMLGSEPGKEGQNPRGADVHELLGSKHTCPLANMFQRLL
jgi:hypothetical protein